ncbi:MAG: HAMP domain-containing protein [Nitrospirae bacterium]|nr:HAMP domain-containing protein [Nitrospirota bacterium]MBF0591986.1 HAMP domain-containing protein [Nitrospirota bacterium]
MLRRSIRYRMWAALLILGVAVMGIRAFNSSMLKFEQGVMPKVIIMALFSLTLLALFTLSIIVFNSLIKLYVERKKRRMGYRFKTKLVIIFVGITLLPSAMLFVIASGLITNYIDKWFTPFINKPLDDAFALAAKFYDMTRDNTLNDATAISEGKRSNSLPTVAGSDSPLTVAGTASRYHVEKIKNTPEETSEVIRNAFLGISGTEVVSSGGVDTIRAAVPIKRDGHVTGVLLVSTTLPVEITNKVEDIQSAYKNYSALKAYKLPLKANFLIILGFITLLVVSIALLIAMRISRGITEPIQNLVRATTMVSQGNFDTVVDPRGDGEIGRLILSFNGMIEKIKTAELSLHNAYLESDRRRLCMQSIINNINSGVIFLDDQSIVLTINGAAAAILDVRAEEVSNRPYTELIKNIHSDEFHLFLKGINLYNFHSVKRQMRLSINGRAMVLRIFIIQVKDEAQNSLGTLVVFDDLTDLIQAEKALAWQEVAKRLTHEIKNPLTPIKLSAERLLKRWKNNDVNFDRIIEKATVTIVKEVDGLQRLVNEFSRYGRMPEIELAPSNLHTLIQEVIDLYLEYETLDIQLHYDTDITEIMLDPEQFKRVLINIFDNAIQAMEENGTIDVVVKEDDIHSHILIAISDNGKGIDEEDKDKLFQPYFSRRKNGTGLGLAIAHRIITEHKGMIKVSNNVPRGSTFKIELPCY